MNREQVQNVEVAHSPCYGWIRREVLFQPSLRDLAALAIDSALKCRAIFRGSFGTHRRLTVGSNFDGRTSLIVVISNYCAWGDQGVSLWRNPEGLKVYLFAP